MSHQPPPASPPSWATDLARQISADLAAIFAGPDELALVAGRLQKLRLEGERAGIAQARDAICDELTLHDDAHKPLQLVDGCGNG